MRIYKESKSNKKKNDIKLLEDDSEIDTSELETVDVAELEKEIDAGMEQDATVDEIADAVTAEVELSTDGDKTYSETKAEAIARKIKDACMDFDMATWAPASSKHKFYKKLDKCLSNARFFKYHGSSAGTDLLVTGLPGSGKTAIFRAWCKERGVKYKYINVKDDDISAMINGFSVHDLDDSNGKKVHSIVQAGSKKLLSLIDTPTVLFLDEFNRAPSNLRAQILTLVNEHLVAGDDPNDPDDDSGYVALHGLLFTVACINPEVGLDDGALALNQAERSRMVHKLTLNSLVDDAKGYLLPHYREVLNRLDPNDPTYKYSYTRYANLLNLASALLNDPRLRFDDEDDVAEADNDRRTMFNIRILTDALESSGHSKEEFLELIDESEMLPKNIKMIHDILDRWVAPPVVVPTNNSNSSTSSDDDQDSDASSSADDADSGLSDYDKLLKELEDSEESDIGMFRGPSASAGGSGAGVQMPKVKNTTAQEAIDNIKSFIF